MKPIRATVAILGGRHFSGRNQVSDPLKSQASPSNGKLSPKWSLSELAKLTVGMPEMKWQIRPSRRLNHSWKVVLGLRYPAQLILIRL
jgi:hypothetical protein